MADTSGLVKLYINGVAMPIVESVPFSPNLSERAPVMGTSEPVGTRREPRVAEVGPIVIHRRDASIDFGNFVRLAERDPDGMRVQIEMADGSTWSGYEFRIQGSVEIDSDMNNVTFSLFSIRAMRDSI